MLLVGRELSRGGRSCALVAGHLDRDTPFKVKPAAFPLNPPRGDWGLSKRSRLGLGPRRAGRLALHEQHLPFSNRKSPTAGLGARHKCMNQALEGNRQALGVREPHILGFTDRKSHGANRTSSSSSLGAAKSPPQVGDSPGPPSEPGSRAVSERHPGLARRTASKFEEQHWGIPEGSVPRREHTPADAPPDFEFERRQPGGRDRAGATEAWSSSREATCPGGGPAVQLKA